MLQVDNLSATFAPILIELLQTHVPAGVEMTVKQVICTYICLSAVPQEQKFLLDILCLTSG